MARRLIVSECSLVPVERTKAVKSLLYGLAIALLCAGMAARSALAADPPHEDAAHAADAAHAGEAHGDAHGHGHAHFGAAGVSEDPAEVKPDLAVYTFVIFLLLLAVLWKFAWGPIAAGLDKREQNIANHIAAAERSNEEAKRMLADYEKKLASAQDEVRAIIEEARRDADHTQQEILAKARSEAQAELERARREIDTATSHALRELAEKSTDLAIGLAGRIVQSELKPADHAKLIQDALAGFPGAAPSKN